MKITNEGKAVMPRSCLVAILIFVAQELVNPSAVQLKFGAIG